MLIVFPGRVTGLTRILFLPGAHSFSSCQSCTRHSAGIRQGRGAKKCFSSVLGAFVVYNSDFQPFSSRGAHKLITEIPQLTINIYILLSDQKKV